MSKCVHCDEALVIPVYGDDDATRAHPFCCVGCLTVFQALYAKGLGEFYDIKERMGTLRKRRPIEERAQRYDFLDDSSFLEKYATTRANGSRSIEFYLEGVHCLACLWLVEKLPEYCPGVLKAKLDLERSVATVTLAPEGRFADCARELALLGYPPHPVKREDELRQLQRQEERATLMRIGVAGAAAGNVMLYAVSIYAGAQGGYATFFNFLTVLFGVPALTYSAWPFYQSAWFSLKNRVLSIDVPISLALLMGLTMGLYNAAIGVNENYFDSLSALVFLLLLSRYFLRRLQQRGLTPSDINFFHRQEGIERRKADGQFEQVHVDLLRQGDVIRVAPEEMLPVDGQVVEGVSHLNASLLTGEAAPVSIRSGEKVFAGTQNLEGTLLVSVESAAGKTRLGRILKSVEDGWASKAPIVTFTAQVSRYFTLSVFALSAVYGILNWSVLGPERTIETIIILLIVTCPCALALAIPLTFIRTLSLAAHRGLVIKSDEVVEKLARARTVFLDKTGTVTHGRVGITHLASLGLTRHLLTDVIWNLESTSRHPVGTALREYVRAARPSSLKVQDRQERPGHGVEGIIEGVHYRIHREKIWADGVEVANFSCEDRIRDDAPEAIRQLRALGLAPMLLSGDNRATVQNVAERIGLSNQEWKAEAMPEDKAAIVHAKSDTVMVGDGANDAVALGRAGVGIAVAGAMDISLRAADVYVTDPGLDAVTDLIEISRETMKVVRRNLVLSLLYNATSVVAVFTGHITPLIAAVIMPLSSLTVLLSSVWGTQKLRALWK